MPKKRKAEIEFDKERFANTLRTAFGDGSQMDFCRKANLGYAYTNRYVNRKVSNPPSVTTLRKMAGATELVSLDEFFESAGYDPKEYSGMKPIKKEEKDLFYPIFRAITNSSFDWRMESKGFEDGKPIEILIENEEIQRWYFIPVLKKEIVIEDITGELFESLNVTANSKVSFITDDDTIYDEIKKIEFPLLSLYLSVIKIHENMVEKEAVIKTAVDTEVSFCNEYRKRPFIME